MTIEIPLTRDFVTIVDDEDSDLLAFNWSVVTNSAGNVYAKRGVWENGQSKLLAVHRIILERMVGYPLSPNELTDHINGDGLDNRRSNLRLATPAQNPRNRKLQSNNTSGYRGVSLQPNGKWRARIKLNGKFIYLGTHATPEQAHEAYKVAAIKYHGEFARFD